MEKSTIRDESTHNPSPEQFCEETSFGGGELVMRVWHKTGKGRKKIQCRTSEKTPPRKKERKEIGKLLPSKTRKARLRQIKKPASADRERPR